MLIFSHKDRFEATSRTTNPRSGRVSCSPRGRRSQRIYANGELASPTTELLNAPSAGTLLRSQSLRTVQLMEVHFSVDLQAKLNKMVAETGRAADDLVEDAMAGYLAELTQTRNLLNRRYDDVKCGKVQLIDGEEAFARLKAKTEAQRNRSA